MNSFYHKFLKTQLHANMPFLIFSWITISYKGMQGPLRFPNLLLLFKFGNPTTVIGIDHYSRSLISTTILLPLCEDACQSWGIWDLNVPLWISLISHHLFALIYICLMVTDLLFFILAHLWTWRGNKSFSHLNSSETHISHLQKRL